LAMPTRPEHIFTCGSPVLSCRFHPTEPALVVGGCQSGQVVVWDVRAGRLPVQRSSLATVARANSHSHPICAMEIIEGGVSTCYLYLTTPLTLLKTPCLNIFVSNVDCMQTG
jgi:dynein intermediate chain